MNNKTTNKCAYTQCKEITAREINQLIKNHSNVSYLDVGKVDKARTRYGHLNVRILGRWINAAFKAEDFNF